MIYLDSCIVIYLIEKHPVFYPLLDQAFRQHEEAGYLSVGHLGMSGRTA